MQVPYSLYTHYSPLSAKCPLSYYNQCMDCSHLFQPCAILKPEFLTVAVKIISITSLLSCLESFSQEAVFFQAHFISSNLFFSHL